MLGSFFVVRERIVATQWTKADMGSVTIITLGNGLWLGILAWLVLGLWLELASFYYCWIGATLISWPVAIVRVARGMIRREDAIAESEKEFDKQKEIAEIINELDEIEEEEGGEGVGLLRKSIIDGLIFDVERTRKALGAGVGNEREFCVDIIYKVLERELPNGGFHIYRGVLSAEGQELLKLWDFVVEEMEMLGNLEESDVEAEQEWMRDQIAKVG